MICTSDFFMYKIFLCCIYEEQYGGVYVSAIKIILQIFGFAQTKEYYNIYFYTNCFINY